MTKEITFRMIEGPDGNLTIEKGPEWEKHWKVIMQSVAQSIDASLEKDIPLKDGERYGLSEKIQSIQNITLINEPPVIIDPSLGKEEEDMQMRNMLSTFPVTHPPSYKRALETKQEIVWQSLARIQLEDAIAEWISEIENPRTKKSYQIAMKELMDRGFLGSDWSLQIFSLYSPDLIVDHIKTSQVVIKDKEGNPIVIKDEMGNEVFKQWSSTTREARISCFIAFTRYLSRKTEGIIRRAIPSKEGKDKTYSHKHKHVKTEAMTRSQVIRFLEELDKLNERDAIIARLCLHGGKRINEVLPLETNQINYEKKQITFKQSKSKFVDEKTIISFEKEASYALLQQLKIYIGERTGLVFITSNGKPLKQNQIDRNFEKAGKRAEIPFRVSPHCLRATFVTLHKEAGFSDSLIMKATGHSSSEMVHRYDKSDIADNVTRKACLF